MKIIKFKQKNKDAEVSSQRKEEEMYLRLLESQIEKWHRAGKIDGWLVIFNAAAFAVLIPLLLSKLMILGGF